MTNEIHIAYVSRHNPNDRHSWSGSSHFMARALAQCGTVHIIEPPRWQGGVFERGRALQAYRSRVVRELQEHRIDVIFSPQSAPVVAALPSNDVPIVFASDVTWSIYRNYYSHAYRAKWKAHARELLERRALKRSTLLLYSSTWAAHSAEHDYGIPAQRIAVVPFGANLDVEPTVAEVLTKRLSGPCRLLFIGVDWYRKGGPIALDVMDSLLARGVDAYLTICGCVPPIAIGSERITVIPFLDKRVPEDREQLAALFLQANFLLLPTRAEAFGMVLCEANAYGVPAISTDTGGVPTVITPGVNGYRLPLDATGSAYAQLIASVYEDREKYQQLVRTSRGEYERRLNWNSWGASVGTLLQKHVMGNGPDMEMESAQ